MSVTIDAVPRRGAGSVADVTVFAERSWRVDANAFYSLGRNTPFDGATFPRRAIATIVGGAILARDGVVSERASAH